MNLKKENFSFSFLFVVMSLPLLLELPWGLFVFSGLIVITKIVLILTNHINLKPVLLQALVITSSIALYKFYGTFLTPESAASLALCMLGFKLLDLNNSQDRFIFLMIGLVVLMFECLFEQTLFTTLHLFLCYVLIIYFISHIKHQEINSAENKMNLKNILSFEMLFLAPLLASLFIFFPRFSTSFGGFGATNTSRVGFSKDLNPGKSTQLFTSEEIAFKVFLINKKDISTNDLYFRGTSLDLNKEFSWTKAEAKEAVLINQYRESVKEHKDYLVLMDARFDKTLFTLDSTDQIYLAPPLATFKDQDNAYELRWPNVKKLKLYGKLTTTASSSLDSQSLDKFKQTNIQTTPRLLKIVNEFKAEKNPEYRAYKILDFFKTNQFRYSVDVKQYKNLDNFLFGEKQGFCEHFASSFTALARLSDLPARVVIGFQGADVNPYDGSLTVKDKFAHSWSEIYLQDKGWTRFDPTFVIYPARITRGPIDLNNPEFQNLNAKYFAKFIYALEAFNNSFSLLLMNYNLETQYNILESIGIKTKRLWIFFLMFIGFISLVLFLLLKIDILRDQKQDPVVQSYKIILQKLHKLGFQKLLHEGPVEFSERIRPHLKSEHLFMIDSIYEYARLRFSQRAKSQ